MARISLAFVPRAQVSLPTLCVPSISLAHACTETCVAVRVMRACVLANTTCVPTAKRGEDGSGKLWQHDAF